MTDAIICLGNTFLNQQKIEQMRLRTEKSSELYKKRQRKIIFTGGYRTRKDLSEAKFMADYALSLGVRPEDLLLEEQANTTIGNAVYSRKIMEKHGLDSAIVVTSPHHLRRSSFIFEKIMPEKKLSFESCRSNLRFIDYWPAYYKEIRFLVKMKIFGIDITKT
ncbi:MAG: YdcF family protein [bacterium]|nr:YdcF family protein [bacterium]